MKAERSITTTLFTIAALYFAFWLIGQHLDFHEQWGLDVVLHLQPYRTAGATSVLKAFSLFGYEVFVPFLMLFVWAGARRDQQFSMGFALLLTECYWLQSVLKLVYTRNRPYGLPLSFLPDSHASYHPSLDLASSSTTVSELYSYPSGHSFASTVAWFTVADHMGFPTWVPVIVVSLVSFSRISLAVHYPHDIVAGAIMGLLFLKAWRLLLNIDGNSTSMRRSLIGHWLLIISILYSNYHFYDTILKTAPTGMLFGPIFCLGILVGIALHTPWVGVKNTYLEGFLRYLVGIPIAWAPFFVLDIFHLKKGVVDAKIIGLVFSLPVWLFCIAPHVFVKLGIAKWREEEKPKGK